MDLESGLRNWAAEAPGLPDHDGGSVPEDALLHSPTRRVGLSGPETGEHVERWNTRQSAVIAALVASLIFVIAALSWFPRNKEQPIADSGIFTSDGNSVTRVTLGQLIEQQNCRWQIKPVSWEGTFGSGSAVLEQGAAELKFGSGTNLVLQAPCELKVTDASTAELLAGSVAVHVTEQSNGFVLERPSQKSWTKEPSTPCRWPKIPRKSTYLMAAFGGCRT